MSQTNTQKKVLLIAPLLTLSGYGEQGRLALRSLVSCPDEFDVYVKALNWGQCGWLYEDTEERRLIDDLLKKTIEFEHIHGANAYDVTVQCTIPNECQKLAPINIGYTAGIETTRVSHQWLEAANQMNRIIVVSNHSKEVFERSVYERRNQVTNSIEGELRNYTPIDVVNYPVKDFEPVQNVKDIKLSTKFNLLTVAQNGPRKNVHALLASFIEEFHDDKDTGLVLKLFTRNNTPIDREETTVGVQRMLRQWPDKKCKVHLLHGSMTDAEMNSLYNHPKIKGYVSLTHGEGFGLPLFEAAYNGLPVIVPPWSGQMDFLMAVAPSRSKKKNAKPRDPTPHCLQVDYTLQPVPSEVVWEGVLIKDSMWAVADLESAKKKMRDLKDNHRKHKATATRLKKQIRENFTEETIYGNFVNSVRAAIGGNVAAPDNVQVFG